MDYIARKEDVAAKLQEGLPSHLTYEGSPVDPVLHKCFAVLKNSQDGQYYLIIEKSYESDDHLIALPPNLTKEGFLAIIGRYCQPHRIPLLGSGCTIFQLHALIRAASDDYESPVAAAKDEKGWHRLVYITGTVEGLDDVAQFENSLIFEDMVHTSFVKQMTASYSRDYLTVVETAYSSSLIEFIVQTVGDDKYLISTFWFEGDSIDDIPMDLKICIEMYGMEQMKL